MIKLNKILCAAAFLFPMAAFACSEHASHEGTMCKCATQKCKSSKPAPALFPKKEAVSHDAHAAHAVNDFQSENNVAMLEMHKNMHDVKFSNNNDVDFMAMMIPHHEGAIQMAEIVLKTSTDKEVRNLAQGIITDQKNEIELMKYLIKEKSK